MNLREKNHVIISINAEKALVKIQHPFVVSTRKKKKIAIKDFFFFKPDKIHTYSSPIASILSNGETNTNGLSIKITNEAWIPTIPSLQHGARTIRQCD